MPRGCESANCKETKKKRKIYLDNKVIERYVKNVFYSKLKSLLTPRQFLIKF